MFDFEGFQWVSNESNRFCRICIDFMLCDSIWSKLFDWSQKTLFVWAWFKIISNSKIWGRAIWNNFKYMQTMSNVSMFLWSIISNSLTCVLQITNDVKRFRISETCLNDGWCFQMTSKAFEWSEMISSACNCFY